MTTVAARASVLPACPVMAMIGTPNSATEGNNRTTRMAKVALRWVELRRGPVYAEDLEAEWLTVLADALQTAANLEEKDKFEDILVTLADEAARLTRKWTGN